MKLSIVTVTRNDQAGLDATVASAATLLDGGDSELVIVDGASTDGTTEVIQRSVSRWPTAVKFISEPDHGIYDAMNKGWRMAKGQHVVFMNSGDVFPSRLMLPAFENDTVYCGHAEFTDGHERFAKRYKLLHSSAFLNHNCFCHQAIFYPRSLLQALDGYDLRYTVSADFDLTLRAFLRPQKFRSLEHVTAVCSLGGVSHLRGLRSYDDRIQSFFRAGLQAHAVLLCIYRPLFLLKHKAVHALEGTAALRAYRQLKSAATR